MLAGRCKAQPMRRMVIHGTMQVRINTVDESVMSTVIWTGERLDSPREALERHSRALRATHQLRNNDGRFGIAPRCPLASMPIPPRLLGSSRHRMR